MKSFYTAEPLEKIISINQYKGNSHFGYIIKTTKQTIKFLMTSYILCCENINIRIGLPVQKNYPKNFIDKWDNGCDNSDDKSIKNSNERKQDINSNESNETNYDSDESNEENYNNKNNYIDTDNKNNEILKFIDKDLISIQMIKDECITYDFNDCPMMKFLIKTTGGDFHMCMYNLHNGYYEHTYIVQYGDYYDEDDI